MGSLRLNGSCCNNAALHQRVPLALGSREDVQLYERFAAGQDA